MALKTGTVTAKSGCMVSLAISKTEFEYLTIVARICAQYPDD